MQIAILAGGLATRLGTLARDKPKSMIKVGGKPFLEYQLKLLREAGIRDIVLCLGHAGEQILRYFGDGSGYGVNLKYNFEDSQLGTAGALKNAEEVLDDTFFTIYGDSYLSLDFNTISSFFKSRGKIALMTVYRNENLYDRSNVAIEGDSITKYSKSGTKEKMVYIDYGVNLFNKKVLKMIPEGQFYSLEELFPRLIENEELLAFEVKDRFYEIGSVQGLKEFESYVSCIKEKV